MYRWWRALNHQGLTDGSFDGYAKYKRAKAVGLLTAAAPMLPLMLSDEMGFERGWLWHGWSAIAISWGIGVLTIIFYQTGKSAIRYYQDWRNGQQ